MSVDLYATLGVERGADEPTIRKAYRKAAKKAHPDTGGSVESFTLVTTAVGVLTDEKRRKTYDETGRIDDTTPDNAQGDALQRVMAEIDFVLAQIEARGLFLDDIDVIGDARKGLRDKEKQIDNAIRQIEKNQASLKKVATKFRAKKGKTDRIGPMLLAKANQFTAALEQGHRDKRSFVLALEILNEHEFGSGAGKTAQRTENLFLQTGNWGLT